MIAVDYFRVLVEQIHTTVVATVDGEGLPVTAAIDMMDFDDEGVYFLTARGKRFYDRLIARGALALTGMRGRDTMHSVALSLRGQVREIGPERLQRLFDKNPYMLSIYPTAESRKALTVFQIYAGTGEWFDLSKQPIERDSFAFGAAHRTEDGYHVTERCIGCQACKDVCPQACISFDAVPAVIDQHHCLHCGNCVAVCPVHAVERG